MLGGAKLKIELLVGGATPPQEGLTRTLMDMSYYILCEGKERGYACHYVTK